MPVPRLACCPACHGFVANPLAACPHCDAAPPPRRGLMRFLASVLLATAGSITLMACYGMAPEYRCDDRADCGPSCYDDYQCDQGDYCNEGLALCEYGGYCTADAACPDGFSCDELRNTCVPGEAPPQCTSHDDCGWGLERCDLDTGTCVATTACAPGGAGCADTERCDANFGLCVPCEGDACGTCGGDSTCGALPPSCPEGTRPAIAQGCYSGACISDAACDAEACAALDEAACVVSDTCDAVYTGMGCTNPQGDPCNGQGACTCESFVYDRCIVQPPAPPPA